MVVLSVIKCDFDYDLSKMSIMHTIQDIQNQSRYIQMGSPVLEIIMTLFWRA